MRSQSVERGVERRGVDCGELGLDPVRPALAAGAGGERERLA